MEKIIYFFIIRKFDSFLKFRGENQHCSKFLVGGVYIYIYIYIYCSKNNV